MNGQSKFYDIYDYIFIPFWKTRSFTIVVIIAILIALAVATYAVHLKIKKNIKIILTPAQLAINELNKLSPEKYKTKEEFKNFYFAISEIMKKYLNEQFGWIVKEKTDDELLRYLFEQEFDKNLLKTLENVLYGSLLIKYANEESLKNQAEKAISDTILIIKTSSVRKID